MPFGSHHVLTVTCIVAVLSGCKTKSEPEQSTTADRAVFTPTEITLKEVGNSGLKELVDGSLTYTDSNGRKWTAPRGTLTDGASVPRLALAVTDGRFDEKFLKAAVVHDAYCQDINENTCPDQFRTRPWKEVHRMFYDGCLAGHTPGSTAKIMFAAVWMFGPRWNDPAAEAETLPEDTLLSGFGGAKNWIEENDPNIEDIEKDLEKREPLLVELHQHEEEALDALEKQQWDQAEAAISRQEDRLALVMKDSPNDLMLLNFQGNTHRNKAVLYRQSDKRGDADKELERAERSFKHVLDREKSDPSALKGMAGTSILRGDLGKAKRYADEAIKIAPNYGAAKRERDLIERLEKHRPKK